MPCATNARPQARSRARASVTPFERRKHALGQRLEAARGDGGQKVALFRKVLVRRIVTDAGAPRDLAQREGPILRLVEQRQRRLDERGGEIAVMIGARGSAAGSFGHEKISNGS